MPERYPHLPPANGNGADNDREQKIYDAEIIHGEYRTDGTASSDCRRNAGGFHAASWSWTSMRGGMGGMNTFDTASRYAPVVTLFLLFIVLFRFGFLACLGFLFFYAIGAAFSTVWLIRRMAEGKSATPWPWRIVNWTVSFLLAGWLSGGFH